MFREHWVIPPLLLILALTQRHNVAYIWSIAIYGVEYCLRGRKGQDGKTIQTYHIVDENIKVVYTFISRPSGTYISAQSGTAATALLQGAIENRTTCC